MAFSISEIIPWDRWFNKYLITTETQLLQLEKSEDDEGFSRKTVDKISGTRCPVSNIPNISADLKP